MRVFHLSGLCGLTLLLAGCFGTAEYRRPAVDLPARWPDGAYGRQGTPAASIEWRSYFRDTRLQSLIAAALANNQDMRVAALRVDEARATLGITNADRVPTVSLNTAGARAGIPRSLTGSTGGETTTGRYDLGTSMLSYEVDLWGRLANLSESARATLLANEASQQSVRSALVGAVANVYYALAEMEETVSLSKATVLNRQMVLEILEKAFAQGAASRMDILQMESQVEQAKAGVSLAEGQRANAENLLRSLVVRMPNELPVGRGLDAVLDSEFLTGTPSDVILARPDIVAAEQRLVAANANLAAARAAFFPKIVLTAGLGLASRSLMALFDAGTRAWNFQPSMSMPLFDGGRTESSEDLAQVRRDLAVAEYERVIQQAFREVADLLAARSAFREQVRSAEAGLKALDGRLRVVEARYRSGAANQMEVLDALRDQLAAQRTLVQVRRGELTTAAQLFKALGGGSS